MKRKVLGYDQTIEYLKKGCYICNPPLANYYMWISDDEIVTIRDDVIRKLLKNGLITKGQYDGSWTTKYILKEVK